MAKFGQTLGEVNAGFSPVAPVRDTSAAQAIQAFGDIAVEGTKHVVVSGARQEAEQISADFMKETENMLTPQEAAETQNFEKRLNALKSVVNSTGKIEEVRTRAAALFKNKVNMFPGLEGQLRSSMSNVLGFDPSGADVRAREDTIESQAKTAQRALNEIDAQAQKLGFGAGQVFESKAVQDRYLAAVDDFEWVKTLERWADEKRFSDALGSEANHSVGVKEANKLSEVAHGEGVRAIQTFLSENGVTESEFENGITPEIYSRIPAEKWPMLTNNINAIKAKYNTKIQGTMSNLDSSFRESATLQMSTKLDGLITRINGKDILARDMQQYDLDGRAQLGKIKGTEAYRQIQFWSETLKGTSTPLPPTVVTAMEKTLANLTTDLYDEKKQEADPAHAAEASADEIKGNVDYLNSALAAIKDIKDTNAALETKLKVADVFSKLTEAMTTASTDEDMLKSAADAWIDVLGDESNLELVRETAANNPFLSPSLNAYIGSYTNRSLAQSSAKINRVIDNFTFTQQSPVKKGRQIIGVTETETPLLTPVFQNGLFDLQINQEAVDNLSPGLFSVRENRGRTISSPARKKLNQVRRSAVADMNRVFKALKNLNGWSDEQTKEVVFNQFFPQTEE